MRSYACTLRRGSMLLFWVLVALPFIFFAGALAVDFATASLARDEVASLASASATAGAWQIVPNTTPNGTGSTTDIDCGNGPTSAQRTAADFAVANAPNTLRAARLVGSPQVQCIPSGTPTTLGGVDTVRVTLTYTTDQSPFLQFLSHLLGESSTNPTWTSTRSAVVCIPGSAPTAESTCTRPAGY